MLGCSAKQWVSLSSIDAGKGVSSKGRRRGINGNGKFLVYAIKFPRSSHNIDISLPIQDR